MQNKPYVPRKPYQTPQLERYPEWTHSTGVALSIGGNTLTEPLEITIPDLQLERQ
jgi:hypothetical protein